MNNSNNSGTGAGIVIQNVNITGNYDLTTEKGKADMSNALATGFKVALSDQ